MIADLTNTQRELAYYMSEISEKCYAASWMQGLEYALWNAVINGEQAYGQDFISKKNCETLRILSEACDSWIYFDESSEETAISLSLWKKMVEIKL
ncbi:hypothetical protein [Flectobacillus sp. BAB-3569]|uniref:hypothetical protein n=1 Tax=Flectobacillus sp. BAB-3569 TaxID=1509483 RepID=UPI000BA3971E|nr:hypothetical protein [Flectobacillus sp. BAB-3569]PAC31090.1 hypothetical protein BWI92_10225 [Flectobacillus sp. BAB-3569]